VREIAFLYNDAENAGQVTLSPLMSYLNGADGNKANMPSAWSMSQSATVGALPAANALSLAETTDSAGSSNAYFSPDISAVAYFQTVTLTIPKLDGKSVIIRLNGARLTAQDLFEASNRYEYVYKKTGKEAVALNFTVDYRTGYAIVYHNTDGAANGNPALYSSLDTGGDKIILAAATKPGWLFLGWYKEIGLSTQVTEIDGAEQIGQIDLYAKWQDLSMAVVVPEKYYVASTYGDAADLSGVAALAFDVNNSTGAAYKFSLGIFDRATEGNAQNEWVNDGNIQGMGSGLFIPTGGRPYWGNVNNIPAGFTGRIVVPLATRYYKADGANDREIYGTYNYVNNPAFKMRASMGAAELGVFDAGGTPRLFPTATMARSFKLTADGTNYSGAVLSNAEFLDGESAQGWEYYLDLMRDLPAVTSLNGLYYGDSVYFNQTNPAAGYYNATFNLKSASNLGTTTTTSLDGALGMAVRITNIGANPLPFELTLHETSTEQLFVGRSGMGKTLKFVFLDGTVGSVVWNGRPVIPARYDGTLIIPFSDFALRGSDIHGANLNARPNNWVWLVTFQVFSTVATEWAVREIALMYNDAENAGQVTLSPLMSYLNGADGNKANMPSAWSVSQSATVGALPPAASAAALASTIDGVSDASVTISADTVLYGGTVWVTIPRTGRDIELTVFLNGSPVSGALAETPDAYIFRYMKRDGGAGALNFTAEIWYKYAIAYSLSGATNADGNPDYYTMKNTGADAIQLLDPVYAYHKFIGWYNRPEITNPTLNPVRITVLDAAELSAAGVTDITLYAGFVDRFTVTVLDGDGGSAALELNIGRDFTDETAADIAQVGYTLRLFADAARAQELSLPFRVPDDMTVYAVYTAITYTVSFEANGGIPIAPVVVGYKEPIPEPAAPAREGFVFDGWYFDDMLTDQAYFDEEAVSDLTLYAKWKAVKAPSNPGGLSPWAIVGISVGSAAVAAGVGVAVYFIVKRGKKV
jgi:uncharacterized repeat protein (TIGR02543 family)